jgi:hypothetical protein
LGKEKYMSDKDLVDKIDGFRKRYKELNGTIPEAGGIAFATLYYDGLPINLTARAVNPYDAISGLALAIKLAGEALGIKTEKPQPPQAPAPKPDVAAEIVREADPFGADEMEAKLAAIPEPPEGKAWQTIDVQQIKVIPQPDGITTLAEFWNPDRQYAEERVKWKSAAVLGLLKHVMTVPVNDDGTPKASTLTCPSRVYFTLGKEYTKKSGEKANYHDVGAVRPL